MQALKGNASQRFEGLRVSNHRCPTSGSNPRPLAGLSVWVCVCVFGTLGFAAGAGVIASSGVSDPGGVCRMHAERARQVVTLRHMSFMNPRKCSSWSDGGWSHERSQGPAPTAEVPGSHPRQCPITRLAPRVKPRRKSCVLFPDSVPRRSSTLAASRVPTIPFSPQQNKTKKLHSILLNLARDTFRLYSILWNSSCCLEDVHRLVLYGTLQQPRQTSVGIRPGNPHGVHS